MGLAPDPERFGRDFRRIADRAKVRAAYLLIEGSGPNLKVSVGGERAAAEFLSDCVLRAQDHRRITGVEARGRWERLQLRVIAWLAGLRPRFHFKVEKP